MTSLPRWAHHPGVTPSPDVAPLEAVKALIPARFALPPQADHPAIAYGIRLHDAGFFWEAHEVLEAAWLATALNSADRILLRGFIQLANAALKAKLGRPSAVARLLDEVLAELTEARTRALANPAAGLVAAFDLDRLIGTVEAARRDEAPVPDLGGFRHA